MQKIAQDRRRYIRRAYLCEPAGAEEETSPWKIENISLGGVFLATAEKLRIGSRVPIQIRIPGCADTLELEGEVVRVEEQSDSGGDRKGYGVRFDRLSPEERESLESLILTPIPKMAGGRKVDAESGTVLLDPATIGTLLREGVAGGLAVMLGPEEAAKDIRGTFSRLDKRKGELRIVCSGLPDILKSGTSAYVYFTIKAAEYYFRTEILSIRGEVICVGVPREIFCYEKRSGSRKKLGPKESAVLEIPLSYGKSAMTLEILDISPSGLSFRAEPYRGLFLPGTPLRDIRIVTDQEVRIVEKAEIRHVTLLAGYLKVGVQLGYDRRAVAVSVAGGTSGRKSGFLRRFLRSGLKAGSVAFQLLLDRINRRLRRSSSEEAVNLVRYRDKNNREIAAIVNRVGAGNERAEGPAIIIAPAYSKRKETLFALALTIVENFRRLEIPCIIVRYDDINGIGESDHDEGCWDRRKQLAHYTLSQAAENINATMNYLDGLKRFRATKRVLISFSLSSLAARKAILEDPGKRIDYWISVLGCPDAREVMKNASGGVDHFTNYQRGIRSGLSPVLGELLHVDRACEDAMQHGLAFPETAKAQMAEIDIPVTWFYGEYDGWVPFRSVEEIMSVAAPAPREIIRVPVGHNMRSSEEALEVFRLMAQKIVQTVCGTEITTTSPSIRELLRTARVERSRAPRIRVDDRKRYWEEYLIADGNMLGYDCINHAPSYRRFLTEQIRELALREGDRLADMGGGTGNLFSLVNFSRSREVERELGACKVLTIVDLIPTALERARKKYRSLSGRWNGKPRVAFQVANLEVNRLKVIDRFLKGEYCSVAELGGRIEGLDPGMAEGWRDRYTRELHSILRGKICSEDDFRHLASRFPKEEVAIITEINRASRFLLRRIVPEDFHPDVPAQIMENYRRGNYSAIHTGHLRFNPLNFESGGSEMALPFRDEAFDKILASMLLSYLYNPEETVCEFYRMLRKGGRLVVSSLKPDADMSRFTGELVRAMEKASDDEIPEGLTKTQLVEAAREFIHSAARLFSLEEEGTFTFFTRREMEVMLAHAGFREIWAKPSFDNPPQAYILVGVK
jgi:uncharacterized protein (TIGR02266 family)